MDKVSKSPILFIITGLLSVIFAFNNCGVGFEANSVTGDLGSLLGFNKLGNHLVTTHYDSDGVAQLRKVPYTVEGTNVMLYGHTHIGSIDDIKSGDYVETPQLASDSRISQINLRRSKLDSNGQQAVNKGGYLSSIRRESNGKRIFFYHWRGGARNNGNVRLEPVSASGLRAKMQAEIDKMNEELSSNNINLELRAAGNGHNATTKVMVLSEVKSDAYQIYWTYEGGHKSNPDTAFRADASQSVIATYLRKRFMIEMGFVGPLFTNKRDDVYNIRQDKITQAGKNLLANPFEVGSDSQFFSADSVLTEHSCWKNVRNDCSVNTFNPGELSFTLKDGDSKVYRKTTFSNSDLTSIKSIFGSLDDSGQAVDVINKLTAIHVSSSGRVNAVGYACIPFSNESVDILLHRSSNGGWRKYSDTKFTANKSFIPRDEIPDECVNANGDKRTNVAFHITGTVRDLDLIVPGRADDYGWYQVFIDQESLGTNAHKKLEGNHFHNNTADPNRFRHGIYDSVSANTNDIIQYVYTVWEQRVFKKCNFSKSKYNNVPNDIVMIDQKAYSIFGGSNYLGYCKPYILEKLFGFTPNGSQTPVDQPDDNNGNSGGETISSLSASHYGSQFAVFSDQAPGFKEKVYKYVSEGVSCEVPSNEYRGDNITKLTPESYAILLGSQFRNSPSCNDDNNDNDNNGVARISSKSSSALTYNWSNIGHPNGVEKYNVYMNGQYKRTVNKPITFTVFTGLSAGTTYNFHLTPVKNGEFLPKVGQITGTTEGESNNDNTPSNNDSGSIVKLYKHCNYSGNNASLSVGEYKISDLVSAGLGNDSLSSLKIPSGFKVELFRDDNFRNLVATYTGDKGCLNGTDHNDNVSSVKVSTTNGNSNPNPSNDDSGADNIAGLVNLKAFRYGAGGEITWENPDGVSIKKVSIDCFAANQVRPQTKSNGEKSVYYGSFGTDSQAICKFRVESNDGKFSRIQTIEMPAKGNGTQTNDVVTVD